MPQIISNGIKLNYESAGEGDPLLLIMGFGMAGAAWLPMLPFLAGFRAVYFDNRGTGLSDKPDGPYTVPAMADDASNLIDALGLERVRVYGISMGGMIAQELALRHPEQVSKMVLGCTTPGGPEAVRASDEVLQTLVSGSKLMSVDPEAGIDQVMPLLFPPEFMAAHPEIKQFMRIGTTLAPPTPPETADKLMAGLVEFNAFERLHEIKCPVLIVHGEKDILVPPGNAALIKSRIPAAEVFMIPEAGHSYAAVDPVGIHQRITSWLRG
ncbi:MAG TPA: alpha/beta hydrolase [Candidatus Binataceae bacterium]|jgi:pimeloyl-ACP methyl ester carboxylesterase|nr:alpha/beta hydrolase [Candidatus Binataceae bacterium]